MNQKMKIAILAVLMLAAAGVFYFDTKDDISFRDKNSPLSARTPYSPLPVENPELQRWKLDSSRRTEYKSNGRDIFSDTMPAPPPPKRVERAADPPPQLPVEPPPPTLPANMKFFGYGTVPNGTSKRAFLTDGEEPIIVAEGDTLLGRFRILKIGNASLEFEELGTGRRNSITLDEQAAASPQ
jgi:hypothetical protein